MILKWIVVAVLFVDGLPANSKIFTLDPADFKAEADCVKLRDDLVKEAADMGHSVWARCVEVDYKPPAKAKPNDKKSEVTS